MAAFSMHGFAFFRHFRRRTYFLCIYVFVCVVCVNSASITNSSENSEKLGSTRNLNNNTQARSQLVAGEPVLALNPFLPGLQLGLPTYQNVQPFNSPLPYQQMGVSPLAQKVSSSPQSQKKRTKVKSKKEETLEPVSSANTEKIVKTKEKKQTRKKEKVVKEQKEAGELEKVESKTVENDGTGRGCPACEGGPCDPFLDTKNNISGIPVIQILVALAVGALWAAIFAFVLHNFIDYDKHHEEEGGYGYGASPTPEYGTPSEYGAPAQYGAPQSEYGAPASTGYGNNHRVSYGYGRRSQGFNNLSNWVWEAVDKLAKKYDS